MLLWFILHTVLVYQNGRHLPRLIYQNGRHLPRLVYQNGKHLPRLVYQNGICQDWKCICQDWFTKMTGICQDWFTKTACICQDWKCICQDCPMHASAKTSLYPKYFIPPPACLFLAIHDTTSMFYPKQVTPPPAFFILSNSSHHQHVLSKAIHPTTSIFHPKQFITPPASLVPLLLRVTTRYLWLSNLLGFSLFHRTLFKKPTAA